MTTRTVQIKLRADIPVEKQLLDYLDSIGPRSGEPKRLLLKGFACDERPVKDVATVNSKKEVVKPDLKPEPEKPKVLPALAGLAVKG